MVPTDAMFSMTSNACSNEEVQHNAEEANHTGQQNTCHRNAGADTLVVNFGAEPKYPSSGGYGPVEYRPAFSEEAAAVLTTSQIIGAVPSMPIASKKVTNGDSASFVCGVGA